MFVNTVEAGWLPTTGSGKHVDLKTGTGLLRELPERYEADCDERWSDALVRALRG
jgi:hypothetical protein